MPGMGGPSGSSGTGTGSTANVYTPAHQPQADTNWWSTLQPLIDASANGGAGTPAGQNYPVAQQFLSNYLTNSPYVTGALDSATTAAAYGAGGLFPQGALDSSTLNNASMAGLPYGQAMLGNGFNPGYGAVTNATANNPYFGQAMSGAQAGARMGGQGASSMFGAGNQIMNAGFDPQNALFNRTQGQVLDQSNVANSMAGIGNTPYGASVNSNALSNFDINWQNNQLNRETTAAGSAAPLFQNSASLAGSSAGMPSRAYLGQLQSQLGAMNAQNTAGIEGSAGFNNMLSGVGQGFAGAQGLGSGAANILTSTGAGPYNMGGQIANNAIGGLTNTTALGNNQYQLPEDVLGALQSYMRLGQNASGISGQLGQMGFNQLSSGISGALSGANSLFGNNGLFSSGGSGGGGLLSGLLGGGGGQADMASAMGLAETGGLGWGGGGDLVAGAAGGGDVLSSLAPMAMSA